MNIQLIAARVSALLYFIIILTGLYGEFYIRGDLHGLVASTEFEKAHDFVLGHQYLSGLLADLTMIICDILLAVCLYVVFKGKAPTFSIFAMIFRLVQAFLIVLGFLILLGLRVGNNANTEGYGEIANTLLLHSYIYDVALLFFGISNLFLAASLRVYRQSLGVIGISVLMVAVIYIFGSLTKLFNPILNAQIQPLYILCLAGEFYLMYWLATNKAVCTQGVERIER